MMRKAAACFRKLRFRCRRFLAKRRNSREFLVQTPIGKLRAYAKSTVDCGEDYPGVFVEFIPNMAEDDYEEELLMACVEYDSCSKDILVTGYTSQTTDEPTMSDHFKWTPWQNLGEAET